jgi:hypothetical protein
MPIDAGTIKAALGIVGLRLDYLDPIITPPLPVQSISLVDAIITHNNTYDDRGKGLSRAYWLGAPDIPEPTVSLREFIDAFLRAIIAVFQSRNLMHMAELLRRDIDLARILGDMARRIDKFEADSVRQQDAIRRFLKIMPGSAGAVGLTNVTAAMFSNSASNLSFTNMLNSIAGGLPFGTTVNGFLQEFYKRLVIDSLREVEDPTANTSAENGVSLVDSVKQFVMDRLQVTTEAAAVTELAKPHYAVFKALWEAAVTTSTAWTNSSNTGILDVVVDNASIWADDLASGRQVGSLNLSIAGLSSNGLAKLQLTSGSLIAFITTLDSIQTVLGTNSGRVAGSNYATLVSQMLTDIQTIDNNNTFGADGQFEAAQAGGESTFCWSPGDSFVNNKYYFSNADGFFYQALKGIVHVSDKTAVTTWSASPGTYASGALVNHNSVYYQANVSILDGEVPGTSSNWNEVRVVENYNSSHAYNPLDMVVRNGKIYEALGRVQGVAPDASNGDDYWAELSYNDTNFFSLNTNFNFQIGLKVKAVLDALNRAQKFFTNFVGQWDNSQNYTVGQIVENSSQSYEVSKNITNIATMTTGTSYTAGSVFNINGTRYIVSPDKTITRAAYEANKTYVAGDFVYSGGYYWKRTTSTIPNFSSSNTYPSGTIINYPDPSSPVSYPTKIYAVKSGVTITQTGQSYTGPYAPTITAQKGDVVSYNGVKYIAKTDSTKEAGFEVSTYFGDTNKWQSNYGITDLSNFPLFFELTTSPSQGSPTYWQQMDTTGAAWFTSLETAGKVQNYSTPLVDFFSLSTSKTAEAARRVSDVSTLTSRLKTFYQNTPSKIDTIAASNQAAMGQITGFREGILRSFSKTRLAVNSAATNAELALAIQQFVNTALEPNKALLLTSPNQSFTAPSATNLATNKTVLTAWFNAFDTNTTRPTGVAGSAMRDTVSKILAMIDSSNNLATDQTKKDAFSSSTTATATTLAANFDAAINSLEGLSSRIAGVSGEPGLISGTTINFSGSYQSKAFNSLDDLRETFADFTMPSNWAVGTAYKVGNLVRVINGSTTTYYKALTANTGYDPTLSANSSKWQAIDLNVAAMLKFMDLRTAASALEGSLNYRYNTSGNRLTNVLSAQQGEDLQSAMLRAFQLETASGLAGGTITHLRPKMFIPEWSSAKSYAVNDYVQVTTNKNVLYYRATAASTNSNPATNPSKWAVVDKSVAEAQASSPELYYFYTLRQIEQFNNAYWKDLRDLALTTADPPAVGTGNGLLKQLKNKYKELSENMYVPGTASTTVCETNSNKLTFLNKENMNTLRADFVRLRNDIIGILNELNNTLTRDDFSYNSSRWSSALKVNPNEMITLGTTTNTSTTVSSGDGRSGAQRSIDILTAGTSTGDATGVTALFDNVRLGNGGAVKYFAPIAESAASILRQLGAFQNFFFNAGSIVSLAYGQGARGTLHQFATWGELDGRFQDVAYDLYVSNSALNSNFQGTYNGTSSGVRLRGTGFSTGTLSISGWANGTPGTLDSAGRFKNMMNDMYSYAKNYFTNINNELNQWQRSYNDFHLATVTQAELWVSRAYATTAPGEDVLFKAKESDDISPEERRLMAKILNLLISILIAMLSSNVQVRAAVFRLMNGQINLVNLGNSLRISTRLANNMIQRASAVAADMLERERANKSSSADFVASNPISTQTLYDLASFWQANQVNQKEIEETAKQQRRYS